MDVLKSKRSIALAVLLGVIACSLTHDWDPNGQPCREEGSGSSLTYTCDEGFNCYRREGVSGTQCVRDGSRRRGEECSLTEMCESGYSCIDGACREACGASYYSPTACRGDEFCKPYDGESVGYCTRGECLSQTCPTGRICVHLKDAAGACLIECTPRFTNGEYSDNCGSTSGDHYCQALGSSGNRRLVCLDTTRNAQAVGVWCNVIDSPCASNQTYTDGEGNEIQFGLTCVNGKCVEFCDSTVADPASNEDDCGGSTAREAFYCCKQVGADDGAGEPTQWGVCLTGVGNETCSGTQL